MKKSCLKSCRVVETYLSLCNNRGKRKSNSLKTNRVKNYERSSI